MNILDLLRPEHVLVPLDAPSVRQAVEQLVARLEETGAIAPSDVLRRRIRSEPLREIIGVSDDVVIPHFRSEQVSSLVLAMGIAREPLTPEEPGLEIRPRVVALILAPQDAATLYLQTTSTLARLLRQPAIVEKLVQQPDARAVVSLPELQDLAIRPRLAVRDVMIHRVDSVHPDTTTRQTMDLMLRRRLRAVPVVGPKGEVLGMVTDSDLVRALLPQIARISEDDDIDARILERPVREIMTRSVLCISEDLGIGEVASMMINKDVEQVPVVQAGSITGMVSRGDIIRKLFYRK
jgi:CBS domain-containing protein/mannitol/fructose-specific phosphotransferase system IIA component (Ntr-type)